VDDGSTDDTVSVVAGWSRQEPRIRLVSNEPPHRFASACNRGAQAALGRYLLFLNNDIEVLGGWFQPLFSALHDRPEVGIAAPKLLFPDGTIQHCGKVMRLDSQGVPVFEHVLYEQPDTGQACADGEFLTVTGACMLVRRDEFFRLGPLDDRYENGWEDDDLCLAYHSQGLSSIVCAKSVMIHHQGGTLKAEAAIIERYLAVMREKGISLAKDDPFVVSLAERVRAGAERFNEAYRRNRSLFHDKWRPLLERLHHAVPDVVPPEQERPDNRVTVIVVTYNSEGTIRACLDSVLSTLRPGDLALVVDNASQDGTPGIVQGYAERDSRLVCCENRENRGYGAAVNQGLDRAASPFVALLNPDTVVTSGWLDRLLAHCVDKKVAAVGPLSNFAAGEQSVDRHWQGPLPDGISPEQAASLLYGWNCGSSLQAPLLIGFCMMIRRAPLMSSGGLDERLFVGNDDLELSWRLRLLGFELKIARDVFVYHEGQHSFRSEEPTTTSRYLRESSDALYRILESHYGPERVPQPERLWGIDWFRPSRGIFNPTTQWHQVLAAPCAMRLPEPSAVPLVSVVILTCNQLPYTQECISALLKHTPGPLQIIMVDNGSSDGTVPWLQSLAEVDPRFCLILNNENRGFAAGCNQGIEKAGGRYVVLLNNDVVVTPEWLAGLLECHGAVPDAGIVGPLTNSASGVQVIETPDYDAEGGLDRFAMRFRSRNRFRRVPSRRIVGFCMLFQRDLSQKIGLLDEAFGTGNYEDDDYCLRAAIAGYRNLIAGDVFVHHHGGVSFRGAGVDYRAALARNSGLFREKWSRPVTDRALAERIAICRTREDLETLLLAERDSDAHELLERFDREFPTNAAELHELVTSMRGTVASDGNREDPGAGLPCLKRAWLAEQQGETEYANALTAKGFVLEPWRPELIAALQSLAHQGVSGLASVADEAARLYPGSRGLARLRVMMLSRERPDLALAAAELFLRDFGADDAVIAEGLQLRRSLGVYRRTALSGMSVALCMIVRNEERSLARCLASCKPVVHELVIVDTGSDDRTRQIAELFGAHLIEHPWSGDFSAARNAGLEAAGSDWLLVMDADEVLSLRDHERFQQVLDRMESQAAFVMTTRNYTNHTTLDGFVPCNGEYPEDESGAGWTPSAKVRLFPNRREVRFEGVVHELVEPSLARASIQTATHPVAVHHYGGLEDSRLQRKREIYYALGLKKLNSAEGGDQKALYELAIQAAELERFDEAEALWRRFLESDSGFAPAWCNFGYVLLRKGLLDDAWEATERALQIQPEYHAARVNRALCAFCRCSDEQAESIIRSELGRFPDDITLQVLRELCRHGGEAITGLSHIVAQGYRIGSFITTTASVLNLIGRKAEANRLERMLAGIPA